jgi:hypothetical protein
VRRTSAICVDEWWHLIGDSQRTAETNYIKVRNFLTTCWVQGLVTDFPDVFYFITKGLKMTAVTWTELVVEDYNRFHCWNEILVATDYKTTARWKQLGQVSIIVQQDATIYSVLYFCKLLYMFWVVTSPIIRSTYNCSRYGLTSARCCNYSYMCSWWLVKSPPKTCRAVYRNIIHCI